MLPKHSGVAPLPPSKKKLASKKCFLISFMLLQKKHEIATKTTKITDISTFLQYFKNTRLDSMLLHLYALVTSLSTTSMKICP